MRGALTAARPQRRFYSRTRSESPLRCPRAVCLLCRSSYYTPITSTISPAQRRDFMSSSIRARPASATQEAPSSATSSTPDITNHYTIFPTTLPRGPPPNSSFAFDASALRREFLQLQNAVHPDKFPQGPGKQRAEALSSRINNAYRTLSDPLSRAQYLLSEFHGVDVLAEDGASKHTLDPETLMEVMDVQETVEELSSVPAAEAEETITRLRADNAKRIEESIANLQTAFDTGDIEAAQAETVRLRFWYSLRDGLREWEPGHGEIRIVH